MTMTAHFPPFKPTRLHRLADACQAHDIPMALLDSHLESGDGPTIRVAAGEPVVDADEFASWAARIKAEAGRCSKCED